MASGNKSSVRSKRSLSVTSSLHLYHFVNSRFFTIPIVVAIPLGVLIPCVHLPFWSSLSPELWVVALTGLSIAEIALIWAAFYLSYTLWIRCLLYTVQIEDTSVLGIILDVIPSYIGYIRGCLMIHGDDRGGGEGTIIARAIIKHIPRLLNRTARGEQPDLSDEQTATLRQFIRDRDFFPIFAECPHLVEEIDALIG